MAAPPEPRALAQRLTTLAEQDYRHPSSGQPVRFGVSTIERWYYRARDEADPMGVLRPRSRRDRGTQPALSEAIRSLIVAQHHTYGDWTFRLLYDNVAVLARERSITPMPSYPTVVRFLNAQGLARRGRLDRLRPGEVTALARKREREVRSFEVAHVHALCHAQWYWAESAQCLVHGLTQALLKRGQPRMLLTDNGSAMLADETRRGLDKLSITHETTLPYSPYQNGKQEVFWNQVEGRLLPMLAGPIEHMTLDALNDATQAWVEMEYQHALHRELGTSPAARCLAGPQVSRPCPEMMTLRQAFAMQCSRVVRQSDGTVSVEGKRFEVPSRLRSLRKLVVRYARWDLAHLWAVDPHTDVILAPLHPLDKQANADRHRRRVAVQNADTVVITPTEVAPLMRELIQQYALTGAPPAYLSGPLPSAEEVTP